MLKPNEWKSSLDVALKDHSTSKSDCSSQNVSQSAPRKVSDGSSVVLLVAARSEMCCNRVSTRTQSYLIVTSQTKNMKALGGGLGNARWVFAAVLGTCILT